MKIYKCLKAIFITVVLIMYLNVEAYAEVKNYLIRDKNDGNIYSYNVNEINELYRTYKDNSSLVREFLMKLKQNGYFIFYDNIGKYIYYKEVQDYYLYCRLNNKEFNFEDFINRNNTMKFSKKDLECLNYNIIVRTNKGNNVKNSHKHTSAHNKTCEPVSISYNAINSNVHTNEEVEINLYVNLTENIENMKDLNYVIEVLKENGDEVNSNEIVEMYFDDESGLKNQNFNGKWIIRKMDKTKHKEKCKLKLKFKKEGVYKLKIYAENGIIE